MAYSISRAWAPGIWTCSKLSNCYHTHMFEDHSSTPRCSSNSQNKTRILQKHVHLPEATFQPGMDDHILQMAGSGLLQERWGAGAAWFDDLITASCTILWLYKSNLSNFLESYYGLNFVSQKDTLGSAPLNIRRWPYLEIRLQQVQLVKMGSSWRKVALDPIWPMHL